MFHYFIYNISFFEQTTNGDNMELSKIMSKDLIIRDINDTFYDISNTMKQYDIGFLPISNKNKIVGVITDRDIVINAISNNVDLDSKIENYITKRIIYVNINDSIDTAIRVMGQERVKRLLVVDNKKIVGILSLSDIINTNINNELLIDNLKRIWEINRNTDFYETEIDEFYL